MNLAIIPARGGSKRIPGKNVRAFHGKPIIAYPIAAARESGCFDAVIVSTDDPDIAEVARRYGADVPFTRPHDLADDRTGVLPVVQHAIRWFADQGRAPERSCCIYATAPFVTAEDIREGGRKLNSSNVDYAVAVTTFESPVQRAMRVTGQGRLEMLQPEHRFTRSQDLEETYHDAGQFFWGRTRALLENLPLLSESAAAVVLPRHRVQDIDTEEDWRRAELLFDIVMQQRPAADR